MARLVQLDMTAREPLGGRARRAADPAPAQHRADPERELVEAERLGDVVVTSTREAGAEVLGVAAGGEEDHRDVIAGGSHPSAHFEAVEVGQVHVEHHQVR